MTELARELPSPAPAVENETAPFWEATAQGVLKLPHCDDCRQTFWQPRAICPLCQGQRISWTTASGRGTLYSYSITSRGIEDFAELTYVLALVELAEGPKLLTNVVDVAPDDLRIGDELEVVFSDTGAGTALPRFRPVSR